MACLGQPDDNKIHLSSDMERPWIRWSSCGSHGHWVKMVKCIHAMGHDVVGTGAIRCFGGRCPAPRGSRRSNQLAVSTAVLLPSADILEPLTSTDTAISGSWDVCLSSLIS